jgi:hypothetical protein
MLNAMNAGVQETFAVPISNFEIGWPVNNPFPPSIPFTVPGPDWFAMITAELLNPVTLSGQTPMLGNTLAENNQVATAMQILQVGGLGSTYHNETNVRIFSTNVTNMNPKPIYVKVAATSTATASINATIGNITLPTPTVASGTLMVTDFIVPSNEVYQVSVTAGTPTLVSWIELF